MRVFSAEVLGTKLSVQVDTRAPLGAVFARVLKTARAFERKYSRFAPDNWLARLNAAGGGKLDAEAAAMLRCALLLARRTDGVFDPTVGPLLSRLCYGPESDARDAVPTDWRLVKISRGRVRLDGGVRLEFGGVGKGYLLGKIAKSLGRYRRFLVDFGGDLYGRGGWDVALEHPADPACAVGTVRLDGGFLCASSGLRRRFGNGSHHLVDPKSGASATDVLGAFVESRDGMRADAYATALCVLPFERAALLLGSGEVEGVIMAADGRVWQSPGSRAKMFWAK